MIRNPFRRAAAERPTVPAGQRVYAIGDIHGMRASLDRMLDAIAADLKGFPGESEIVFLGDYIDRGPDSASVVARLVAGPGPGGRWTFLKGNHDAFLADLIASPSPSAADYTLWIEQGGLEAMRSWGVSWSVIASGGVRAALAELRAAMPAEHLAFFETLGLTRRIGDYFFVHAGIRPGVALEKQQEMDLIWIRDEFLSHRGDHGVHIVHGHTITAEPDRQANRTGVDTGAYAGGALTALVLEGDERRFLAA